MHELAITQDIVAIALRHAEGANVKRVVVEIGKLTAVLPDAVRFCFDICTAGTAAAGAKLEIIEIGALARCRACRSEVRLEQPFGQCRCGSADLEWLRGEELRVKEMELDD